MNKIIILSLLLVVGMGAKSQGGVITFPSSNLPVLHFNNNDTVTRDTIPVIILYSDTSKQIPDYFAIPFGSMDSARNIDMPAYDNHVRWIFGYEPRHITYGNQDCINCPHSWMTFDGVYLDAYKQPLPKSMFVWMAQQIPQPDTVIITTVMGAGLHHMQDYDTLRKVWIDTPVRVMGKVIPLDYLGTYHDHMPTQLTVKRHKVHKWAKKSPPETKD